MLYGLLVTLYIFVCIILILIILIQKGKSNLGIGSLSGSSQLLFGGSGGQDLFQKITWVLGAIFMLGSLTLALMRAHYYRADSYFQARAHQQPAMPAQPVTQTTTPAEAAPAQTPETATAPAEPTEPSLEEQAEQQGKW